MGVDARMVVKLAAPISDEALIDASYRIAEAVHGWVFWQANDDDLQKGETRRALNRLVDDEDGRYRACGVGEYDGSWLWVSLWGRYYGPHYERGDLWHFIAVAEWLEANLPGCLVFYGGDSGETIELFNAAARRAYIAHWAGKGGRPYYAGEGRHEGGWAGSAPHPLRPTCPLCQHPATQYGSGAKFASWTCDGCKRHWIWIGGEVKAFPPRHDFDLFKAAAAMRAELAEV